MHQQRQQCGAHDDAGWPRTDPFEDAVDDRIEHAGIRHDAEEEDGEYKHPDYGRNVLDACDDEATGLQTKASEEGGDDRQGDQGNQGDMRLLIMLTSMARMVITPSVASIGWSSLASLCAAATRHPIVVLQE